MTHVLALCTWGHILPLSFDGTIQRNNIINFFNPKRNSQIICAECAQKPNYSFYKIIHYDPTFVISKFHILKSYNYNELHKVLTKNNFSETSKVATNSTVNQIWETADGLKVIVHGKSYLKKQILVVLTPEKHPLITEISAAIKMDRANIKANSVQKPKEVLPKIIQDACGEDIKIGDWVAYSSSTYADLYFGKIVKLNPKSVSIRPKGKGRIISGKCCSQIIKIPDNRAFLWEFES